MPVCLSCVPWAGIASLLERSLNEPAALSPVPATMNQKDPAGSRLRTIRCSTLPPHWRRRHAFLGFFRVIDGVLRSFNRVLDILFVHLDLFALGPNLFQNFQKLLAFVRNQIDACAHVLLFL